MKRVILFLGLASAGFGQWIVNDPANTAVNTAIKANDAANHVEILRQWAGQLEKLNQQLRQLEAQLAEQRRIREVLGDPGAAGARMELGNLGAGELARTTGETVGAVRRLANALASLRFTADGLYRELGNRTLLGRDFPRQEEFYRRFSAVERQAGNLNAVREQSDARVAVLQGDVAATVEGLKTAQTQAEVDKLSAQLAALNGQLAAEDARRQAEADQLQALSILNENQAAKERQDFLEKQIAEERESLRAVGAWQRSLKLTPTAYTRP